MITEAGRDDVPEAMGDDATEAGRNIMEQGWVR